MTPEELKQDLRQFTGTEGYTRWSPLFRNFVLTDGAKYLAENAGAYWLMDAVATHVGAYRNEPFVVAKLARYKAKWMLELTDGNDDSEPFATQLIEYSDFPLDEIELYVIPQEVESGSVWVILLPSEY